MSRSTLFAFLFALLGSLPVAAHGADAVTAKIGFDGRYRLGCWTPVFITLRADEDPVKGQLVVTVPDGDGLPTRYAVKGENVALEAGESASFLRYVKVGRAGARMTIAVVGEDGPVVRKHLSIDIAEQEEAPPAGAPHAALSTQELLVVVGDDVGLDEALHSRRRREASRAVTAVVSDPTNLPDQWLGYEGVSTLVITTAREELAGQWTAERVSALRQWVCSGGRVVMFVGARGEEALAPDNPLADLAPGTFKQVVRQRQAAGLEIFINAKEPLRNLAMTLLSDVRGQVEFREGRDSREGAALVRAPLAMGEIVFVAFDLDQPPFVDWPDRRRFIDRIFWPSGDGHAADEAESAQGRVSHLGFDDLTGQLRAALDNFPGVLRIEFSWVAALLVVYIALIGAGDYFLLRALGGRMEWTWLTFPLAVVGFCALAWGLAAWSKGDRLRVNQVSIIDVDVETSQLRGTTWAHLFSPRPQAYDLKLRPLAVAEGETPQTILSWQGLPGTGLGAMNARAATLLRDPYSIVSHADAGPLRTEIVGLPVQQWSTKSLQGRWVQSLDSLAQSDLELNFAGMVEGRVVNPLKVPLEGAFIYHNGWAYPISRTLGPGQSATITSSSQQRDLEWKLTKRRVDQQNRDFTTPWDRADLDVESIVSMMMFHEAAGGRSYTNLSHAYQSFVDASDKLWQGRAVLVGRLPKPGSQLRKDDLPLGQAVLQQWTYCRIILPVKESKFSS